MNSSKSTAFQDTKKASFGYVYGYYFKPLKDYYHGILSRLEIELLEYYISLSDYYLRQGHTSFYHSYNRIHEDTAIATSTLKTMVTKFKELGLLTTCLTKQYGRKVTTYQVDHLKIIRKRRLIFGKPEHHKREALERINKRCVALAKMYLKHKKLLRRLKWRWSGY